jgi:serine phosphatase RsbU (regulator of sigma subunit)
VLLYTDGLSEPLADQDGRAEERFMRTIARAADGGGPLLDTFLAEIQQELAGQPQADDVTLLTARLLGPANQQRSGPT